MGPTKLVIKSNPMFPITFLLMPIVYASKVVNSLILSLFVFMLHNISLSLIKKIIKNKNRATNL